MHRLVERGAQVAGGAWFLSWFALYLEIFRWRHVTPAGMARVVWPAAAAADQPGGFVRVVVVCSAVAPLVFLTLVAAQRLRRIRPGRGARGAREATFVSSGAVAVFGGALTALGAINQMVRRPPLVVDFTLQRGNGGFMVLGAALTAAGVLAHPRKRREASRRRPT